MTSPWLIPTSHERQGRQARDGDIAVEWQAVAERTLAILSPRQILQAAVDRTLSLGRNEVVRVRLGVFVAVLVGETVEPENQARADRRSAQEKATPRQSRFDSG
jgi:hypothetical protein